MTYEELNRACELRQRIMTEQSRLEDLRLCAVSVSGSKLDDMPKATPLTSKVEKLTVQIMEAEEQLRRLRAEYYRSRQATDSS